ncbi:MAG: AMP-binding protein [Candidatus Omnitrophica bacterium]|nr:AMP-binding protein [Candidatus Omnitrophota bacterium]
MDFLELLERQANKYPEKPCLIFQDSSITFKELKNISFNIAKGLSNLGVRKAEKIAIFLPNIPEYIYSFLGIFILRGVSVPLDYMLTEEEVVNFINHSESKVLIAQAKKGIDLLRVRDNCPGLKRIVIFGEDISPYTEEKCFLAWKELIQDKGSLIEIKADDEDYSSIFYTSGSTGHPKGVLLNYAHFKTPIETLEYFLHPTDKDSFLCAGVPFSHVGGLDYMLFMLYFGTTLVLMERFQPLEFLKNIEKHKLTIFCIVPSMYVAVLSLKEYDKFDLSSLRYAVVFGAPSSPVLLERFHKVCPNAYLLNGWGMTETAAPNTFLPTGTQTKEIPNTGKFPPGTEAKIIDDTGNSLPDEREGELLVRGKAVMLGYYKEPELTNLAITQDHWLQTGDIAKRDSLGRYFIVGRKKEMIKVGGEIVFSPEVEEVIHRHPKVQEVGVIGVPDKLRGEVPKAFVVPKEGGALTEEELRFFLREHLAHFKIPHYFEFKTSLPKNRVGKIDKEKLRS